MMEKIDFVLPWVDGNDLEWQEMKDRYEPANKDDSHLSSRFRDMEVLKYVLRSIEQNCPWYNRIFLITTGHYPEWLDINHEKIILVKHEELYFHKEHLPVFNSSSIEMNLPRLSQLGLSEHFVYLNDDTLIFRPTDVERFFRDGKPVDFLSHGWIARGWVYDKLRGMTVWLHSLNNNLRLINRHLSPFVFSDETLFHPSYDMRTKISNLILKYVYKRYIWLGHWHHPQPYLRKTMEDVFEVFEDEMMACSKNRFRSDNDLTHYLYRYWHLSLNDFSPCKCNDGYDANITDEQSFEKVIKEISTNQNIRFVGINDHIANYDDFKKIKVKLLAYLEEIFPVPASFER